MQIVVCVAAPIPRAEHNFAGFANSNFERQRNARRLPRCNPTDKRIGRVVVPLAVKVDNILVTGEILILVDQIGVVFLDANFHFFCSFCSFNYFDAFHSSICHLASIISGESNVVRQSEVSFRLHRIVARLQHTA